MEFEQDALTGAQDQDVYLDEDDLFGGEPEAEDQTAESEDGEQEGTAEDGAEEPADRAGEGADEAQEAEGAQGEAGDEPKYKVKFYGQEMELPVSQLVTAAQKGMDYDNLRQRYEAVAPAVELMTKYAQQSGMDLAAYVEFAQQQLAGQEVQKAVAEGVPEQTARELYELRQREAQRKAQLQAEQAQQQRLAPYLALLKEHPGLKELPPEVTQRIGQGMDPVAAYAAWENAQLKAQLAAQKTAQKNKQSAPGSARGLGKDPGDDPFLAGFNED